MVKEFAEIVSISRDKVIKNSDFHIHFLPVQFNLEIFSVVEIKFIKHYQRLMFKLYAFQSANIYKFIQRVKGQLQRPVITV